MLVLLFASLLLLHGACAEDPYIGLHGNEYDFVVIGAGTAGSIVASKIAERGYDVLLVEEGPHSNHPGIYNATDIM